MNTIVIQWAFEGCLATELRGLQLEPHEVTETAETGSEFSWFDKLVGKDKLIKRIQEETVKAVGKPLNTGDEVALTYEA